MKHIRSVVAAGLLTLGTAGIVSAQAGQTPPASRAHVARAMNRKGGPARLTKVLFRGIQLSDAEKARIKTVREAYKPRMQALRQSFNAERKTIRELRQRGDTAAIRAEAQKLAPQRQQAKTLLEAMRTDIRGALTTENQAKFDANATRIKTRIAQRADSVAKRLRRPPGQRPGRGPSA